MKTVFAIVAGLLVGVLFLLALEAWLLALIPPPPHWLSERAAAYTDWLAMLNLRHKLMLLGGWMMAGAVGGALAAAIRNHPAAGWLCGLLLAASAILLASLVSYPFWLAALLIISPLAGAVAGVHFSNLVRGVHS